MTSLISLLIITSLSLQGVYLGLLTLSAHAQRGLQYLVCHSVSSVCYHVFCRYAQQDGIIIIIRLLLKVPLLGALSVWKSYRCWMADDLLTADDITEITVTTHCEFRPQSKLHTIRDHKLENWGNNKAQTASKHSGRIPRIALNTRVHRFAGQRRQQQTTAILQQHIQKPLAVCFIIEYAPEVGERLARHACTARAIASNTQRVRCSILEIGTTFMSTNRSLLDKVNVACDPL